MLGRRSAPSKNGIVFLRVCPRVRTQTKCWVAMRLFRGSYSYFSSRTRAWLASVDEDAVGQHLSTPLIDSSMPSPGTLSANSTPPPAEDAQPDAEKPASVDTKSIRSNNLATRTPTTLDNKQKRDPCSNESTNVLAKGWRAPASTPLLLEEDEQVVSDDDNDDDDDLSSWSSEVALFYFVLSISSCRRVKCRIARIGN